MRLFSADIYSHITPPHKAETPPGKPAAVCSGANSGDARGDPHIESLHAPKSVAHPCCAASGPGPECPVHGGVDTDASTLAACASLDAQAHRSPAASLLAACHRVVSR